MKIGCSELDTKVSTDSTEDLPSHWVTPLQSHSLDYALFRRMLDTLGDQGLVPTRVNESLVGEC